MTERPHDAGPPEAEPRDADASPAAAPPPSAAPAAIGPAGENLGFLLGLPRSGTTLASVLLDKHPKIACPPEPWLMLALDSLGKTGPRHPADSQVLGTAVRRFLGADGTDESSRAFARSAYDRHLRESGKALLIDKTPRYHLILDRLDGLFPAARWLWLRRDPLDVAASYLATWRIGLPELLRRSPEHPACFDFVVGLRRLIDFAERKGGACLALRYETLVRHPAREVGRALGHLGLDPAGAPDPADLRSPAHDASPVGDPKIGREPAVHDRSVGTWRTFEDDDLRLLLDVIGAETFTRLGYHDALDRLAERGVRPGQAPDAAMIRARVEERFAARVADLDRSADLTRPLSLAAQHAIRRVFADPGVIEGLEADVRARAAEKTVMQGHLDERRAALQGLSAELLTTRQRVAAVAAKAGKEAARADQAETRLTAAETRLTGTETRLAEVEAERAVLKTRLRRSENALVASRNRAHVLENRPFLAVREHLLAEARYLKNRLNNKTRLKPTHRPWPRITLVTPAFNAEATIRDTIESVLSQGYPNLEYIVVDGGSTDATAEIARSYGERIARVVSEPDRGMYDALAKGMRLATGDVLGYLNADDMLEPWGLQRVGARFRDHKRTDVVYFEDTVTVGGWRFPNAAQPARVDLFHLLNRHILFQDGVFYRRSAYLAAGGFNPNFRLAGDWDMWVRLARRFRLHRMPGHVSSFRMRKGQLSGDMDAYNEELDRAREAFLKTIGRAGLWRRKPGHWLNRAINGAARRLKRDGLHYPIGQVNLKGALPPGRTPPPTPGNFVCDVTGRAPDRLLFSTRDTRFADRRVSYLYMDSEDRLAVTYPPLSKEELNELYETHYSKHLTQALTIDRPGPGQGSPYREFVGGSRLARKISELRIPGRVTNKLVTVSWGDTTPDEILENVEGVGARRDSLRFLDVGCFEGRLLDTLAERAGWQTCGIEPNRNAVEVARKKGHRVWQGFAEDAPFVVPAGEQFDVVFMGQTIEHFTDPGLVLRRLGTLLAPGGVIALTTPNLDSKQIELFGPTWAHWHLPYHRMVFSPKALRRLGRLCGLETRRVRSYSHPYWTAMSLQLNRLGLGASVPHGITFHPDILKRAHRLTATAKLLWDRRGRGDYLFAVLAKPAA